MTKLNAAILEAYEGYQTALDCVKGWKQEAASRKAYCMALINAARKSNPELGAISAKELFARTAEMYEAAEDQQTEDQEVTAAEDQQTPGEDQEVTTAGEEQEAPADD